MSGDKRHGQSYAVSDLRSVRQVLNNARLSGTAIASENSVLESQNFSPSAGWQVKGDGNATFKNATIGGNIVADSIATGVAPNERIELRSDDDNTIRFYTGDVLEDPPDYGYLFSIVSPTSGAARASFMSLVAPRLNEVDFNHRPTMYLWGEAADGSIKARAYLQAVFNQDYMVVRDSGASSANTGIQLKTGGKLLVDAGGDINITSGTGITRITGTLTVSSDVGITGAVAFPATATMSRGTTVYDETSWTTPTLLNSWVDYGLGRQAVRYKKTGGQVEIQGVLKSGTIASPAFTLPAGYRPASGLMWAANANDAIGRLDIEPDGDVIPSFGSNVWFSICCTFTAG